MTTLTVASHNLMGLEPSLLDERTEAACFALLLHEPPDVVLLQEVVDRTLRAHLLPHLRAAGFSVAPSEPVSDSSYYCLAAVGPRLRPTAAWRRPFAGSQMGRALLGIDATLDGRPVRVCTGHLESLREGRRLRRAQVRVVADALAEAEGEALFAGDTNLRGEVDDELRAAGLVDAWQAVGAPADGRSTWWPWRGPRRATGPRFDRLWCTSGLAVREVSLTDPRLEGGERVSDHACLRVRLGVG